jgi:hypothetical protein
LCEPDCSDSSCGAGACPAKRMLWDIPFDTNGTFEEGPIEYQHLSKRVLPPIPQALIGPYMGPGGPSAQIPILQTLAPPAGTGGWSFGSPSYCVQQAFASAPLDTNGQYRLGTVNTLLTGCTVLALMSSRGVYMVRLTFLLHLLVACRSLILNRHSVTSGRTSTIAPNDELHKTDSHGVSGQSSTC